MNNRDNINLAKAKTGEGKEKSTPKKGKKGNEQGDEEIVPGSAENEKKQRLEKLRKVLENISEDYEEGRQEFSENNKPSNILSMQERVCLIKLTETDLKTVESREGEKSDSDEAEISSYSAESSDDESGAETDQMNKELISARASVKRKVKLIPRQKRRTNRYCLMMNLKCARLRKR